MGTKKSIAFYSHNMFGLGHIVRSVLIAESVLEQRPDYTCHLVTGCKALGILNIDKRIIIKHLPALTHDHPFNGEFMAMFNDRGTQIKDYIAETEPDAFLVDNLPFGLYGELVSSMDYVLKNGLKTKFVFGAPYPNPEDFFDQRNPKLKKLLSLYQHAFIYSDMDFFQFEISKKELNIDKEYLGLVAKKFSPGNTEPEKCIVAFCGAGTMGISLLDKIITATRSIREKQNIKLKWITGPLGDFEAQCHKYRDEVNLELIKEGKVEDYIQQASVAIARCGYNTSFCIMQTNVPVIFVPYLSLDNEQVERAEILAERVNNVWDLREADSNFSEKLNKYLQLALANQHEVRNMPFKLDGARRAAERLINL